MCSTLNLEEAETCKLCGSRLKPTGRLGTPSEEPGSKMRLPSTGELPPWLARLRKDVTGRGNLPPDLPPEEPSAPDSEEIPLAKPESAADWLGRMRQAESENEGPPEGEVPDWIAKAAPAPSPAPAEGEVPDWLARIRAQAEAEAPIQEKPEQGGWPPPARPPAAGTVRPGFRRDPAVDAG